MIRKDIFIFLILAWPFYLNDIWLITLGDTRISILWSIDVLTFLLIPCLTTYLLIKRHKLKLLDTGLLSPLRIGNLALGFVLCILLLFTIGILASSWLNYYLPMGKLFTGYPFPSSEPLRSITKIYAAITAGVIEEVIFRGILITLLLRHFKSLFIVGLISICLFGLIHWGQGPASVLKSMAWAIIPTIWYLKARNLWGLVVCHIGYDYFIFIGLLTL